MSYNLFLDDLRTTSDVVNLINRKNPHPRKNHSKMYTDEHWFIVRNHQEFEDILIKQGLPTKVSFDHDLCTEHYSPLDVQISYSKWKVYHTEAEKNYTEKTGLDCAKTLVKYVLKSKRDILPQCFIHSRNVIGSENIELFLHSFIKLYSDKKNYITNAIEHIYCLEK